MLGQALCEMWVPPHLLQVGPRFPRPSHQGCGCPRSFVIVLLKFALFHLKKKNLILKSFLLRKMSKCQNFLHSHAEKLNEESENHPQSHRPRISTVCILSCPLPAAFLCIRSKYLAIYPHRHTCICNMCMYIFKVMQCANTLFSSFY